ncbi:hypothetical protein QJS66_22730 [Kocuria rhizophila]|nr:hypothetical protein QJS66_22730 [Kocuria rhizophila]
MVTLRYQHVGAGERLERLHRGGRRGAALPRALRAARVRARAWRSWRCVAERRGPRRRRCSTSSRAAA